MSNYDKLSRLRASLIKVEGELEEAHIHLDGINPDGGEQVTTITPLRFEAAYRALSRHLGHGGHDYYDQWTPAGQRAHRGYARAVLEGAGFNVQEGL